MAEATSKTIFRLATKNDEEDIYDFGEQTRPLGFPTIVAERDGKILGYLSTQDRDDQIIVGPLYVTPMNGRGLIAHRLFEVYDLFMRTLGVTMYRFSVHEELGSYIGVIKRMPEFQYEGLFGERHVFKREM